jgi:hypothetical protein
MISFEFLGKMVRVWKAGRWKIVREDHPDTQRWLKVRIKKIRNKKKLDQRMKKLWKLMPVGVLETTED